MLEKIIAYKKLEIEDRKRIYPLRRLLDSLEGLKPCRDFASALKGSEEVSLIAEIKKASPSKGIIRADFNPETIAKIYTQGGAKAISVLTDEQFFLGHLQYLEVVRKVTDLPLLRKDFIIDPYQIYEARVFGADAILLIAAILEKQVLVEYLALAHELGMQVLVEVHTEEELQVVLETSANIIGINNRNLKTFETNLETTFQLKNMIQNPNTIVVSESGIKSYEDVKRLKARNINAMLVGETLMRIPDIKDALNQLLDRRFA